MTEPEVPQTSPPSQTESASAVPPAAAVESVVVESTAPAETPATESTPGEIVPAVPIDVLAPESEIPPAQVNSSPQPDSAGSPQAGQTQTISPAPPTSIVSELLVKARATIQTKRLKKLERIMEFVAINGSITNDEVEKLLHVSDKTATRYLKILVAEGKLKCIGVTGRAVSYEKA